jgi:hypothetical protein
MLGAKHLALLFAPLCFNCCVHVELVNVWCNVTKLNLICIHLQRCVDSSYLT